MKELSIEEKAKAYDEALERMKSWARGEHPECFTEAQKTAEFIFPELCESEDELTWLTKYIKEEAYSLSMDIRDNEDRIKLKNLQRSLDWLEKQSSNVDNANKEYWRGYREGKQEFADKYAELEKQGEQKSNPVLDIEIPFGANDSELQEASYHIPEGFHAEIDGNGVVIKRGEQKPVGFNIGDEITVNGQVCRVVAVDNLDWSEEDEKIRQTIINEFKQCSEWYCSNGLTKEDCINWLNKQEYFEWGDEDNENMNSLCVLLDQMVSINAIGNEHSIEYKNWLKSIKQRMGG